MANSNFNLRLQDQKYTEAEYLFKTIEMAKSDEEYDDICIASSPPNSASEIADIDNDLFSWKVVKRRKPQRRHTVSHSGAPPAPPSTPTSLTAAEFPNNATVNNIDDNSRAFDAIGSYHHDNVANGRYDGCHHANGCDDDDDSNEGRRFNSLLFILDYAPKFKKKLKDQRRLDNELAAIFNDITITGKSVHSGPAKLNTLSSALISSATPANTPLKSTLERGVCYASRAIRKYDVNTKTFKIHRNSKEFLRDPHYDDEDSASAPEFDATNDEDELYNISRQRRLVYCKTKRIWGCGSKKYWGHKKRINDVIEKFDATMNFNGLQHKLHYQEQPRHEPAASYFNGDAKSDTTTTLLEPKQSSSNTTAFDLATTANTSTSLWWSTNQAGAFNGIGNGP